MSKIRKNESVIEIENIKNDEFDLSKYQFNLLLFLCS